MMTMSIAYVLINTEIGGMEEVLRTLEKIPEVKEAHMFYGVYDIIAKIETESLIQLKNIISSQIRRIKKIRQTYTMIAMD
jgi:DNA-binding Lrp family transcriptional regulator